MTETADANGPVPRWATVDEMLVAQAESRGSAAAISDEHGWSLSYTELLSTVDATAARLRALGIGRDDVVLVSVPHAATKLVSILAVMGVARCAPMNPAYSLAELETMSAQLSPRAAVTMSDRPEPARELARAHGLPLLSVDRDSVADGASSPRTGDSTDPSDVALILHTAGTTAAPKQVPLTHGNLVTAANNVVASLRLDTSDRCLNVMPLFHSHGLLGAALSSLASGSSITCCSQMDPRRFLEWARTFAATWYSAAPTIHQLVASAPGDWDGFRFIRSASAPLPPQVARDLEQRFEAPVIEVYGMTEAYQIAANPLPPGERRLGTVGIATGTEIRVIDDRLTTVAPDTEGEVAVRGPAVFAGYSAPPGANETSFTEGWFRTGDLGRLSHDGYLTITGRIKEQINRGGEKISPREVDEAVLAHPDVTAAMAFGYPDAQLGEELGVAVVLRSRAELGTPELRRFLAGRISPFKIPRRIVVVDELPRSSTGKLLRIGFSSETDRAAHDALRLSHSGTELEDLLAAIWVEVLELEERPSSADRFFDLGGTSLLTMHLVEKVEQQLGVDLPIVDVIDVPTLGEMTAHLRRLQLEEGTRRLLRRYRAGTGDRNVILIPGQFGMAVGLDLIADALGDEPSVWLFDYPGNRPGESTHSTVENLSAVLLAEIDNQSLAPGQLVLYGNSLGGWVAFDVATRLEQRGARPLLVGIGDMYSPWFNERYSPTRPPFRRRLINRLRRVRNARQQHASTRQTSSAAHQRQARVLAASETARRKYTAKLYEGDVLVIVADERAPKFGDLLGWDKHAHGKVSSARIHGRHSDMHRAQADAIAEALLRVSSDSAQRPGG